MPDSRYASLLRHLPVFICAAIASAAISLLVTSCGRGSSQTTENGGPLVVVSIPPLAGLVEPLLPETATVRVLVPTGRSVHGYRPTPDDIAAIGRADALVLVGMGLETGMARSGRNTEIIKMADVIGLDEPETTHDHHDHTGHDHSGHDHGDHALCGGSSDPHLWLDPALAAQFVRGLPEALPEQLRTDTVQEAAQRFATEIDAVGDAYRERLGPFKGRSIVTHHASFNRPAERYGLEVAAVLRAVETLEPSPAEMAEAMRAIREKGVGAIFIEPQFGTTSATRVAESAGVELVTLDPLGNGDWLGLMRTNLDALVQGLSLGRPAPENETVP